MTAPFLGTGWRYPVRVGPAGGLVLTTGPDEIAQSIWLVLATAPGERAMRPTFGCGIHQLVFSPNNPVARGDVGHHVREALTRWEPRIDVLDVQVTDGPGGPSTLLVRVDYRIRATNSFGNLVYPFFVNEQQGA